MYTAADPHSKEKEILFEETRIQAWINILATLPLAILTTPLDVLKTRVMAEPLGPDNKGAFGHLKTILREEGAGVLFRGVGLRCLYVAVVASLYQSTTLLCNFPLEKVTDIKKKIEWQDPTRPGN